MEEGLETITFPYPMSEQELRAIFIYLGRRLDCLVEYKAEVRGKIGIERFDDEWTDLEEKVIVGGAIQFKNNLNTVSFSTASQKEGSRINYRGIQFDTIPGYSKDELLRTHTSNPNDMSRVRNVLKNYFSK